MSKKYIFHGRLQDTFDEYQLTDNVDGGVILFTLLRPNGEGLLINGRFITLGGICLDIVVTQECNVKPSDDWEWRIHVDPSSDYKNLLSVRCPNDTVMTCLNNGQLIGVNE